MFLEETVTSVWINGWEELTEIKGIFINHGAVSKIKEFNLLAGELATAVIMDSYKQLPVYIYRIDELWLGLGG
ncbi:hypothetical protein A2U01_0013590 [Trifolium medium]|uniref:Uncharacterized protein n=1 Tax=Trifolium medium TaxID=97028 RepID=A0A392MYP8_9FABA|nr:hypothetical protein [Trifolium medium]